MGRVIVLSCIFVAASCTPDDASSEDSVRTESRAESGHDNPRPEPPEPPSPVVRPADSAPVPESEVPPAPAPASAGSTPTRTGSVARHNQCERLRVHIDEDGRRRYRRIRRPWTKADQQRFAQLVGLVAKEMGAEPRLIRAWAMRESTYRPHAMHVLNPDIEAATAAWRRLHYSAEEEAQLETLMAELGAREPEYWKAKARLHQVRTFRDNAYLDDIVQFDVLTAEGEHMTGSEPAWAFGYGPFGFNPAYFVPVWDSRAPPWVFCDDDGLVAIITAVWAARTAQRECEGQGFEGSYATVNRRFSRGHCARVPEHASFRARARRLGLDPDARARLGRRWKRAEADRYQLRQTMRRKAVSAGLLPPRAAAGA